jgi:mannitol/fructose-specific phosphotransferase system IIA component (Ntr-type)
MTIADILAPGAVQLPVWAQTPMEAIRSLAGALALPARCADEVELSALARERAGSTGVGGGVALPHGSCAHLRGPRLAVGRLEAPVDFRAPDAVPVRLVFLLAVPQRQFHAHLYPLATLSQLPGSPDLLSRLEEARTPAGLYQVLGGLPL